LEQLIKTDMYSCLEEETWGKVFNLSDFGITKWTICYQVRTNWITNQILVHNYIFSLYCWWRFPDIVLRQAFIRTSGAIATKTINGNPEIMELDFYQPIIVPAGIKKILVIVKQMDYTNYICKSFL
jgi:hypothetical protein